MKDGMDKGELWTIVLDGLEEIENRLNDLKESDDISSGEKKAIKAMNQKMTNFYNYGLAARNNFWEATQKEGGAK